MPTPLPFDWQDELEQMRRDQNPKRYRPQERPALHLPVPALDPPPNWPHPTPEPESPRVIIIDL
jgi:hypothetical protein